MWNHIMYTRYYLVFLKVHVYMKYKVNKTVAKTLK